MTQEELLFFNDWLDMLPLYRRIMEGITKEHPDVSVRVLKTQISLRSKYVFAAVSLPWRKISGWPERHLLVTFMLPEQALSPRIKQAVEPYPHRWTHHVPVEKMEEIDGELMGWLAEAYRFSLVK